VSSQALADEDDSGKACESLAALSTQVFRVDTSQWVEASIQPAEPGGATAEVPSHCLFRVVMDPRPSGIEGVSYGTGIELRLPLDWNGRLLFRGGGGQSTDRFDMLAAIQQWVEKGQAPDPFRGTLEPFGGGF